MIPSCKIVVYHYIRPIKESRYPEINGLEKDCFIKQIQYFQNNFNFITVQQLLDCIYKKEPIPENSILLTFDDGFKDHYLYVFPILKKFNIQGLFFPPARAIEEKKILDVHKVHFILANCKDKRNIINEIFTFIERHEKYKLNSIKSDFSSLSDYDRFDTKEVVFIKRIFQRDLPKELRNKLVNDLFVKFVGEDQESFSNDLYLSLDEIKDMQDSGMYFGSHGYSHEWLSSLPSAELELELKKSLAFYLKINKKPTDLIMCYPYGDYNDLVIKKIKELGFKAGLTTEVGDAELIQENAFRIRRYDTNDFPK